MEARILRTINGLSDAEDKDGKLWLLRIKGKVLQSVKNEYNPLAVGDIVAFEPYSDSEGLITERLERRSMFSRWNMKGEMNQAICANMDQVMILISVKNPPFRMRFLDRALCSVSNCPVLIVANKIDLGIDDDVQEALSLYESIGYDVTYLSALSDSLAIREKLEGKVTAIVGQSGVGKSTLVNALTGSGQKTGRIVEKYDRGRHTTNHSILLRGNGLEIIDTPGVREIMVPFEEKRNVLSSFPELRDVECRFRGCLHQGEDGCRVPYLVSVGKISAERYESYLRILDSLDERRPLYERREKS